MTYRAHRYGKIKWSAVSVRGKYVYAIRNVFMGGKRRTEYLHRLVAGAPKGKFVDHVSHETLDNRKVNLRVCSREENARNRNKSSTSRSAYKGVSHSTSGRRWHAKIFNRGREIYIGMFECEVEAALAYDLYAKLLHGEFAKLNFPIIPT